MFRYVLIGALAVVTGASSLGLNASTAAFNQDDGFKGVYLSAAAYCGFDKYQSIEFTGSLQGFKVTKNLHGFYDVEGFIGYLPSDKTIYVSFRGSSDIQNWIANLEVKKEDYKGDCCGQTCQVHKGFYDSEQSIIEEVVAEVRRLQSEFPSYSVRCTGHSLGAALALLTSFDLANSGIANSVYNYGQPRVGDQQFASCAASKLTVTRVTHLKDVVPHSPFESWGYVHESREAYESTSTDVNPQVKDCSSSNGEDLSCSDQWALKETNVDDHLLYLGLKISDCNIVKDA